MPVCTVLRRRSFRLWLRRWRTFSVTCDPSKARDAAAHVALPAGAEPFDSGTVKAKGAYRHTFTVAGRFRYFCIPHERMGMVGEVEVLPH